MLSVDYASTRRLNKAFEPSSFSRAIAHLEMNT
jgi:hypothetical protein